MQSQMLAPAAVLVAWSLIVLFWSAAVRFPAMARMGIDAKSAKPGGRGQDLEGVLPDRVNWKSHNYTHLMEQPTLFYVLVVILALEGATAMDALFAWTYVALRVLHSLWQATVNRIPARLVLFTLGTGCLIYLTWRALAVTLFA